MAVKKKTKAKTGKKTAAKSGKKAVAKTSKKAAAKKAPAKKAPAKKVPEKVAKKAKEKTPEQAPASPVEKPAAVSARPKAAGRLRVTLTKSVHGRLAAHQACAIGLGLRRRHQTVEVEDTPCVRGMINKIHYMLEVEGQ